MGIRKYIRDRLKAAVLDLLDAEVIDLDSDADLDIGTGKTVNIQMPDFTGFHDPDLAPAGPDPGPGMTFEDPCWIYLDAGGQTWEIPVNKGDTLFVSLSRVSSQHFHALAECDRRYSDN